MTATFLDAVPDPGCDPQRPTRPRTLREIKAQLDWDGLSAIQQSSNEERDNKLKYLETDAWLTLMWKHALALGLDRSPPLAVLDIGTGPGYFPFICRELGHECIGLDRPAYDLYAALCAWVGTEVVHHIVRPGQLLPAFGRRFDIVTAYRAPFNYVKDERRLFTTDDWAFFLDDLRDHVLKPGGAFVMKMIKQHKHAGPQFGDPPLMELFAKRGATVDEHGRMVVFRSIA